MGEPVRLIYANRLLRPERVSAGILMLTYLSTLRSKSRRFLFSPQKTYFENSPNTSHRLRVRSGEYKVIGIAIVSLLNLLVFLVL